MGKKNKLQVSSCAVNPICENICRFTPAQWHVDFDFTHFETFSFCISENLNSSTAFQGSLSISTLAMELLQLLVWGVDSWPCRASLAQPGGLLLSSFWRTKIFFIFFQLYQDRDKHKIGSKLLEKMLIKQSSPRNKKYLTFLLVQKHLLMICLVNGQYCQIIKDHMPYFSKPMFIILFKWHKVICMDFLT